jgi:Na+/H+ antiporter NhaC
VEGASAYGALSLLPPLVAIVLAMYTRRVHLSLAAGIWLGWTVVAGWHPGAGLAEAIEATIGVLGEPSNARVLVFTFGIGSLIAVVEANGGVRGFVRWMERREWVTSGRRAQLLAWLLGIVIFIESNITILVAGSVSRPLFDRFGVSREKLAYIIDSTSAPVCILIPFNAWGAYVLGILGGLEVDSALAVFLLAVPMNLYALSAVTLAGLSAAAGLDWGPMEDAQRRAAPEGAGAPPAGRGRGAPPGPGARGEGAPPDRDDEGGAPEEVGPPPPDGIPLRAVNMVLPIAVMVITMPVGMWITGDGSLADGSGTTSVLWAVLAGLAAAWTLTLGQRLLDAEALSDASLQGAGELTGMALVLLLALALGNVTFEMGTGEYVAGLVEGRIPPPALLPLLFLTAGLIAFATGSSWGTFAIVLPLAVPLAGPLGMGPAAFLAAVLSGGIFGDHCSPISDTTIISSLAAATDHVEHVRTQLPYALTAGAVAAAGFAVIGAVGG